MQTEIDVSIEVTVEDRDGMIIPVDDISGNLRDLNVILDVAIPTEEDQALLAVLEDYNLTAKELRELLEEPSIDKQTARAFVLNQSADYKLSLVQAIIGDQIPF